VRAAGGRGGRFATLPPPAGRVLDLGCGDGVFGARVAGAAGRYGVDTSADRLRLAAATGTRVARADAAALPYPPASLDAVIANSTLEHLPDPGAAVREVARVLRPHGRFVWTVPLAALLDNLHFGAGPGGADYRRRFTAYWEHVTMLPAAGWAGLVDAHAPALRLRRQCRWSRRGRRWWWTCSRRCGPRRRAWSRSTRRCRAAARRPGRPDRRPARAARAGRGRVGVLFEHVRTPPRADAARPDRPKWTA